MKSKMLDETIENIKTLIDKNKDTIPYNNTSAISHLIKQLESLFLHLKQILSAHEFSQIEDEIQFFKEVKPYLFGELIYWRKIYDYLIKRPLCSVEDEILFVKKELSGISSFFSDNIEFIKYYRSDMNYLDEYYFLRGKQEEDICIDNFYFERKSSFSTHYDCKVAKYLAYTKVVQYLNAELLKLQDKSTQHRSSSSEGVWTDSKNALIELLYALQEVKSINHGNLDLKQLTTYFEIIFKIELGDVYRAFIDIKRRSNRTMYLDKLKINLLKRMDEADK